MIVAIPFLEQSAYFTAPTAESAGIHNVHLLATLEPLSASFNQSLVAYAAQSLPLLHIDVHGISDDAIAALLGPSVIQHNVLDAFRDYELLATEDAACYAYSSSLNSSSVVLAQYNGSGISQVQSNACYSFAVFDNKAYSQYDGLMNILKTVFVIIVLGFGSLLFTNDAEKLVIQPIERMVTTVTRLAEDPLGSVTDAKDDRECELWVLFHCRFMPHRGR